MFIKSDLESGMLVKYEDGSIRVVIGNCLVGESSGMYLSGYTDDLKHETGLYDIDIVAVYPVKKKLIFKNYFKDLGKPLWKRNKKKPVRVTFRLTLKEILKEIAERIGCDVKDIEIVD
jgi:hypothetical protein